MWQVVCRVIGSHHHYQPFYCEENVWWLAQSPSVPADCYAIVITNRDRRVAMRNQRAGEPPDHDVVWDYHVVLADDHHVWDLDCVLGMPLTRGQWIASCAFTGDEPWFRIVAGKRYIGELSSDRSHMRDRDGKWLAPPPSWPCIGRPPGNLDRLLDLDDLSFGPWIDLATLRAPRG